MKRSIPYLHSSDKFVDHHLGPGGSSSPGDSVLLEKAYSLPSAELLRRLSVIEGLGLSEEEVLQRRELYGANILLPEKALSPIALVMQAFADPMAQLLLLVAAASALFASTERSAHALAEPGVIFAIILLNSAVSVWQSYSADKCVHELTKLQPEQCYGLRAGVWTALQSSALVPGDIIRLRVGDKVPADCRVLRGMSAALSVDESSLTGESEGVLKTADPVGGDTAESTAVDSTVPLAMQSCMIFSGSMVTRGACEAVVVRTGSSTEIGKIREDIADSQARPKKTPLEQSLGQFSTSLLRIVGVICVTMWASNANRFDAMGSWTAGALHHAKGAVALGVAAVPEGLPAAITLCLSLGTRRMARKNAIIRKLSSLETLGSTTVICTDKTGTLTTNQMTVRSMVTTAGASGLVERAVDGDSYVPSGEIRNMPSPDARGRVFDVFASVCALCNDAELHYVNNTYTISGEPTEGALRVLVEKLGDSKRVYNDISSSSITPHNEHWRHLHQPLAQLEFTRERKSMSVLVSPSWKQDGKAPPSGNILFAKGAAEVLLHRCSRVLTEEGRVVPLRGALRAELEAKVRDMSRRPMRCLALAYKDGAALGAALNAVHSPADAAALPILQNVSAYEQLESDMVLVGVCGIVDPPRADVAAAIAKCRDAGVRVMMITGDSKDTALAIAREVGITDCGDSLLTNGRDYVISGKEFVALPQKEQKQFLSSGNKIFCRVEPRDKKTIVTMLSELGEVVAMTGDGVNDASALSAADIGIAMGITGTAVAKGAADMILMDDSFATIVAAVEEGRGIYSNMQTFIAYLISCNMGEIVTLFTASLLGIPEPLSPLHLLWMNLVTDGPPAAALGLNPTDGDIMKRKPRSRNKPFLTKRKLTRYLISSLYVGLATLYSFVWWYADKGVSLLQLRTWQDCFKWKDFAHSALAPHWPEQPCDIFSSLKSRAQSFSLTVLIVMEMLKALEAVSPRKSILQNPPWRNPWLVLGIVVPLSLHIILMYFPPLAAAFGLYPLSRHEWKVSSRDCL